MQTLMHQARTWTNNHIDIVINQGTKTLEAVTPAYQRIKRPKIYVVYIKIEKTGSSTVSNVFYSYGYRHKRNMMMSTQVGKATLLHCFIHHKRIVLHDIIILYYGYIVH